MQESQNNSVNNKDCSITQIIGNPSSSFTDEQVDKLIKSELTLPNNNINEIKKEIESSYKECAEIVNNMDSLFIITSKQKTLLVKYFSRKIRRRGWSYKANYFKLVIRTNYSRC
ncbi:MAG: hypothetical protein RSF67_03235 [Clostridia bacterium]